jgi:hypothetical protein
MIVPRSPGFTVHRLRTIRQRRWRARKGQVSAVATIFGLMLVVTFISNFILLQLPGEEASNEYAHVLEVENQLATLQSVLFLQSKAVAFPYTLTAPVTLGSQGVPPFGQAATSTLELLNDSYNATFTTPQLGNTFFGGIQVQMNNVYSPGATVDIEQGAEILSQFGLGSPLMLENPDFIFNGTGANKVGIFTLFSFVGNAIAESGLTTAIVKTQMLGTNSYSFNDPPGTTRGVWYNLTTAYPQAWAAYWDNVANFGYLQSGPTCTQGAYAANCFTTTNGATTVSVEFNVTTVTVNQATIGVSFE